MKLPNDKIVHYESKDGISVDITFTELVHCKDCKYYEETHLSASAVWTAVNVIGDYCNQWDCNVGIDDFCSHGERRDGRD